MHIRVGYDFLYHCAQATPMILLVNMHYSRASDIVVPDYLTTEPSVPITAYRDPFGNWCTRLVAPAGQMRFSSRGVVRDSGQPDVVVPSAPQHAVEDLPEETLVFLRGSRYCETDVLSQVAWDFFAQAPPGWARVQAICDYVHTHLAITLCRCMNIPARYCTGYLGDIGMPPPYSAMDFAAWMEVYLGGRWYTFDPRNNVPRIGRVLMARGRDAADVAITTTFGPNTLERFTVVAEAVGEHGESVPSQS